MIGLGAGVGRAFHVAAGELGMCTAAWLFVREVSQAAGAEGVAALRDELGRDYPVLDAVAAASLAGASGPVIDPQRVVEVCASASHVVVVGLETAFLDALVPQLGTRSVALLAHGDLETDWARVAANYGGRVELTALSSFQRLAGRSSVIITFAYGLDGQDTYVGSSWLRVSGPDVRAQFRSIVAWDVLRASMFVYPRWLVAVRASRFSHLVR